LVGCKQAYTKPKFEELDDAVDPWAFVFSANVVRRHLTGHERGMVIKAIAEHKGVKLGTKGGRPKAGENHRTVRQLATDLGVSVDTLQRDVRAAETYERLPAEKKAKVDAGEVSLNEALRQSPLASDQAGCRSSVDQRPRAINEP
jgi:hypothetical protein